MIPPPPPSRCVLAVTTAVGVADEGEGREDTELKKAIADTSAV
jgi:hypothetical protein